MADPLVEKLFLLSNIPLDIDNISNHLGLIMDVAILAIFALEDVIS